MLLHKLVFLFFYYSYSCVCTRLYHLIYICIRCEKHLLSFTSFISSAMRTPLSLSSKPLTKVLLFNFFIPVIFNVQHIYCLELSTSSVEKGIPHQPDWLIQTSSPNALPSKISETCLDHTEQYLKALRNRQLWAVKSKF